MYNIQITKCIFSCFSDTVLSNLEPLEGEIFDVSLLSGFQSHHLDALVKIAFLRDSRTRADSATFRPGDLEKHRDQQEMEAVAGNTLDTVVKNNLSLL